MDSSHEFQSGQYNYINMFDQCSELYNRFNQLVDNPGNFYQEMLQQNLLPYQGDVLSIGAGQGELELMIMQQRSCRIGYVEPSAPYNRYFNKQLNLIPDSRQKILDYLPVTWQSAQVKFKYDLAVSIHSWYAAGTDSALLDKALASLKPGGKLLIAIMSEQSFASRFGCSEGRDVKRKISAESLSYWAHSHGYQHQYFMNYKAIPRERLIINGELTREAQSMAAFLCFTPWATLEPERRRHIHQMFMDYPYDQGTMWLSNGCLLFSAPATA